jgi:two-component system cell cycle sensor histidine kinase/response regulator CckA
VTDTGVGMTPDVQSHIFEPFFTTKESGKGTGLGLATVYGIVKQSGGHVTVYSEKGHGTTFKIYLPRVNESMPRAEASVVSEQAGGSEIVLLVEDETAVRRLARQMLRSAGYTVLEAANGNDALRVADENSRIDLVVTDLVMPGLGGHHLMQRLREKRPDVQVLFMSGYAGNAVLDGGALETGASFIEKPFTPTSFLAKVREVLDEGKAKADS